MTIKSPRAVRNSRQRTTLFDLVAATCEPHTMYPPLIQLSGGLLGFTENAILNAVLADLRSLPNPANRSQCDVAFGKFSGSYLAPCIQNGQASRALAFSIHQLIPAVLQLEQQRNLQFHKGALFHDVAYAATEAGNEDLFDYLLAMTDEEEHRTTGHAHPRGRFNLQNGGMAAQVLARRVQFACDFLNGAVVPGGPNYAFVTGRPPITSAQLDAWRAHLKELNQFELWRVVHDLETFAQPLFPGYLAVADNPFVLLRLAKAIAHLAQLIESILAEWQHPAPGTIATRLHSDPAFGAAMCAAAGNQQLFVGDCPQGSDVGMELTQLMQDVQVQAGAQRHWRLLRILWIVRNSTAHSIDPTLPYYSNLPQSLELARAVFISLFLIRQLRGQGMP